MWTNYLRIQLLWRSHVIHSTAQQVINKWKGRERLRNVPKLKMDPSFFLFFWWLVIGGRDYKLLSSSDPHPETLFWHSFWHTIWKYLWHIYSDIHSGILSGIYSDMFPGILSGILSDNLSVTYSDILSGIYSGILSGIFIWHSILAFYLASILTFSLPWALWHSAVPTEIWSLRLRSASARWHLELAVEPTELLGLMVEVRLCPLRSGAGSSAAVPTEIWSSQFSGSAHWDLELEGRKAKQLW